MSRTVAIIGTGPAGLAAAEAAIQAGADAVLVDGAAKPGGQFHRNTAKSVWALERRDAREPR